MNAQTSKDEARALARSAGKEHYREIVDTSLGDAQRGLRYVIARLSLLDLSEQDRKELADLGWSALQELEVDQEVARITARKSASPLAVAIAEIVGIAPGSKRAAMFGSVTGAYLGIKLGEQSVVNAIRGAIAGATAMSTATFLEGGVLPSFWREWASPDD